MLKRIKTKHSLNLFLILTILLSCFVADIANADPYSYLTTPPTEYKPYPSPLSSQATPPLSPSLRAPIPPLSPSLRGARSATRQSSPNTPNFTFCPEGYSPSYQQQRDCGTGLHPEGWNFSIKGRDLTGNICGKCEKRPCEDGYSTKYQSINDCDDEEDLYKYTFISANYSGDERCGKCSRRAGTFPYLKTGAIIAGTAAAIYAGTEIFDGSKSKKKNPPCPEGSSTAYQNPAQCPAKAYMRVTSTTATNATSGNAQCYQCHYACDEITGFATENTCALIKDGSPSYSCKKDIASGCYFRAEAIRCPEGTSPDYANIAYCPKSAHSVAVSSTLKAWAGNVGCYACNYACDGVKSFADLKTCQTDQYGYETLICRQPIPNGCYVRISQVLTCPVDSSIDYKNIKNCPKKEYLQASSVSVVGAVDGELCYKCTYICSENAYTDKAACENINNKKAYICGVVKSTNGYCYYRTENNTCHNGYKPTSYFDTTPCELEKGYTLNTSETEMSGETDCKICEPKPCPTGSMAPKENKCPFIRYTTVSETILNDMSDNRYCRRCRYSCDAEKFHAYSTMSECQQNSPGTTENICTEQTITPDSTFQQATFSCYIFADGCDTANDYYSFIRSEEDCALNYGGYADGYKLDTQDSTKIAGLKCNKCIKKPCSEHGEEYKDPEATNKVCSSQHHEGWKVVNSSKHSGTETCKICQEKTCEEQISGNPYLSSTGSCPSDYRGDTFEPKEDKLNVYAGDSQCIDCTPRCKKSNNVYESACECTAALGDKLGEQDCKVDEKATTYGLQCATPFNLQCADGYTPMDENATCPTDQFDKKMKEFGCSGSDNCTFTSKGTQITTTACGITVSVKQGGKACRKCNFSCPQGRNVHTFNPDFTGDNGKTFKRCIKNINSSQKQCGYKYISATTYGGQDNPSETYTLEVLDAKDGCLDSSGNKATTKTDFYYPQSTFSGSFTGKRCYDLLSTDNLTSSQYGSDGTNWTVENINKDTACYGGEACKKCAPNECTRPLSQGGREHSSAACNAVSGYKNADADSYKFYSGNNQCHICTCNNDYGYYTEEQKTEEIKEGGKLFSCKDNLSEENKFGVKCYHCPDARMMMTMLPQVNNADIVVHHSEGDYAGNYTINAQATVPITDPTTGEVKGGSAKASITIYNSAANADVAVQAGRVVYNAQALGAEDETSPDSASPSSPDLAAAQSQAGAAGTDLASSSSPVIARSDSDAAIHSSQPITAEALNQLIMQKGAENTTGYGMKSLTTDAYNAYASGNAIAKGVIDITDTEAATNVIYGIKARRNAYNAHTNGALAQAFGTINIKTATNKQAYGIFADENIYNPTGSTVNLKGSGSGNLYGLYSEHGSVYNQGDINVSSTNGNAYGIYVKNGDGQLIENSGNIIVAADNQTAYGIFVENAGANGMAISNTGTIIATGDTNSRGIKVIKNGANIRIDNKGKIIVNGAENPANQAIDLGGAKLVNTGTMQFIGAQNLDSLNGQLNLAAGSNLSGDSLTGNVNLDKSIVKSDFKDTYTSENIITAENIDGLVLNSESALFSANLEKGSDNNYTAVAQRKNFAEFSPNSSISQYLEENYKFQRLMDFYDDLKDIESENELRKQIFKKTGADTLINMPQENLRTLQSAYANIADSVLQETDEENRIISGADMYSNDTDGRKGASGYDTNAITTFMYGDKRINHKNRLGLGVSYTDLSTSYDNGGNHKESFINLFIPWMHKITEKMRLATILNLGYGFGKYDQGSSDRADISDYIYGITNKLTYNINLGDYAEFEPALVINAIGYYADDMKNDTLEIKGGNHLSIEAGIGGYLKKELMNAKYGRLTARLGGMYYRELADPYNKIRAGFRGGIGHYTINDFADIYSNDRAVLSAILDYEYKNISLYLKYYQLIQKNKARNLDMGIQYNF